MTYDKNKPGPNDLLSNSQVDIQQNFLTANTVMDKNHYPFDDLTANAGKHKFLEIPIPAGGGTIPAGLAASEAVLYAKTANGASQLFYTNDNLGNEYQITRVDDTTFPLFGKNTNNYNTVGTNFTGGWSFIAGGMLLQYGTVTNISGQTNFEVKFPVPFTTNSYAVTLGVVCNLGGVQNQVFIKNAITTTSFFLRNNSTSINSLYWMAIGV